MDTLRVITSSSQRRLVAELATNLQNSPQLPLERETIVVLSNGMARWISMELAVAHGVSAGLEFRFPNDLLDSCFRAVLPHAPSSAPFMPEAMAWRIAGLLPDLARQRGCEPIAAYLGNGLDDRHLLQLSRSLAECFDQYTIFRPEIVIGWDNGVGDDWQPRLWRAISRVCEGTHRAALLREFSMQMTTGGILTGSLPRRVSLFGISYLPPFHLEALRLLSSVCEVTCYLLNPCGQYWGTIISARDKARLVLNSGLPAEAEEYYETGNPLLSSLGTLGQEFFESLLEYGFECEELNEEHPDTATPLPIGLAWKGEAESILATIQSDILRLHDRPAAGPKTAVAAADRSLQIHSCHGPLREMEILYDNLLAQFDELEQLEPRQIVVMIPDIEGYAPFINAVFGSRSGGRPALPFTISDRSIRRESPYAEAFLNILELPGDRCGINRVLEVLETPAVMARFDISGDELATLRDWLQECGVRWGLDADHRAALGFPPFSDFSWQAGLDRLFLGYALAPDGSKCFNGILPYPAIEGRQAMPLGKLAEFIQDVSRLHSRSTGRHTLAEWGDILGWAAETMLQPDPADSDGPSSVARALSTLREAQSSFGFDRPLGLDAVRDHIRQQLSKAGGGYGFMGGAITFCAMLPMRSIPMRVVCLAGMNDGQFPRTSRPPGFSLMSGARRRGDRSLRDEDRYLFLEALMSAGERLCISYNGQSDRDKSILPPSVAVAELQDYITGGFVTADGSTPPALPSHHRLQGFSPAYFDGHEQSLRLYSYDRESCQALEARRISGRSQRSFLIEPLPPDPALTNQIDLHQLRRFLANPSALFLGQRLKITPFNPSAEPEEREPFTVEGLSGYSLAQQLVSRILEGAARTDCYTEARSRGILPPLSAGKAAFDAAWEKGRRFADAVAPRLGEPLEALDIQLEAGDCALRGTLDGIRRGTHLRWRCAGMKGKDRLFLWLDHLLLNALAPDGYPRESMMIAADMIIKLPPLADAGTILADLLALYREGLQRPLPFFPQTSWLYLTEGIAKARARWSGTDFSPSPAESSDPAIAVCFGDQEPLEEEFGTLAERVYSTLRAVTLEEKR